MQWLEIFIVLVAAMLLVKLFRSAATTPVVSRRCTRCDIELPASARFCPRCGDEL